ncbi:MAG: hypothetical protein PGN09_09320, partial [Sphingomonas fennica]
MAAGDAISQAVFMPPPDAPNTITRRGSPPKLAMLSCNPGERHHDVQHAGVTRLAETGGDIVQMGETEEVEPVIEADDHHVAARSQLRPVAACAAADHEEARMQPNHDRAQPIGGGIGRPDVKPLTILVLHARRRAPEAHLLENDAVAGRIVGRVGLGSQRAEGVRRANAGPRFRCYWRLEPVGPGVGYAQKGQYAVLSDAAHATISGFNDVSRHGGLRPGWWEGRIACRSAAAGP